MSVAEEDRRGDDEQGAGGGVDLPLSSKVKFHHKGKRELPPEFFRDQVFYPFPNNTNSFANSFMHIVMDMRSFLYICKIDFFLKVGA